jgi:hypothetical protein
MDANDAVICSDRKCNWVYYNTFEKCPRCGNTERLKLRDIIKDAEGRIKNKNKNK